MKETVMNEEKKTWHCPSGCAMEYVEIHDWVERLDIGKLSLNTNDYWQVKNWATNCRTNELLDRLYICPVCGKELYEDRDFS